VDVGPHGRKIKTVGPPEADFPPAVPLMVVRLGTRAIATIPGEMTVEMGRRVRAAVLTAAASAGVKRVVLSGYANEFLHYFTTPEEYEMQHYEGGSTIFGKYSSNLIRDDLATLAGDLAQGRPAPAPADFDPRNGVVPDFTPYGRGAARGVASAQPVRTQRIARASFSWTGAAQGLDRPLDRRFVTVQRRAGRRWRAVANDLGLQILWRVDDDGHYRAEWQVPLSARVGRYRFVVTANRYRLRSRPFRVVPSTQLMVRSLGGTGKMTLDYPPIAMLADLTLRPAHANGGRVTARLNGRRVVRRKRRGTVFRLPRGARIAAGQARDRWGNRNGRAATLR
jgi:neutral ceramidase